MKALSLTQPWASLVAVGAKRIETRSWSTSYRGRVAIHAFGLQITGPMIDARNLERLLAEVPVLGDWEFHIGDVDAVLDEFAVPTESGGVQLSVVGRIRALWSKTVQETNAAWAATQHIEVKT